MSITKQIAYKHGVSENGELQVYQITQILKDGKIIDQLVEKPYSPEDPNNMGDFDDVSIKIAEAIYDSTVIAALEAEQAIPTGVGLEEIVSYDRMVDAFSRIAVRQITRTYEDGVVVNKSIHRSEISPVDDASNSDVMTKAVANKLHTQAVQDAYLEAFPLPVPKTLEEQQAFLTTTLYTNVKQFINYQPNGYIRYDADLKMNIMNASMTAISAGGEKPANCTLVETWIYAVQTEFFALKTAISEATSLTVLNAVDVSLNYFEGKYGREGITLVDPGISTDDLFA
jgi:hypothetical protein